LPKLKLIEILPGLLPIRLKKRPKTVAKSDGPLRDALARDEQAAVASLWRALDLRIRPVTDLAAT
jgi:hypothetical protein